MAVEGYMSLEMQSGAQGPGRGDDDIRINEPIRSISGSYLGCSS